MDNSKFKWKTLIEDDNLNNFLKCIKNLLSFIMKHVLHKYKSDKIKPLIYDRIDKELKLFMHGITCNKHKCHNFLNVNCSKCNSHKCSKCKHGVYLYINNNYKTLIKYIKMYNKMLKQTGIIDKTFNITFKSFISGLDDTAKCEYYILLLVDIKINEFLLYVPDDITKEKLIPILNGLLKYSEILIKKIKITRTILTSKNIDTTYNKYMKHYNKNNVMIKFLSELKSNKTLQEIYSYDPIVQTPKIKYKSSLFGRSEMVKLMLNESINSNEELDGNDEYKQSVMNVTTESIDELIDVFDKENIKSINDLVGSSGNLNNPLTMSNPRTKSVLKKSQTLLQKKVKNKEISPAQIADLVSSVFNQQSKQIPDKSDPSYEMQKTLSEMFTGINKIIKDKNLRKTGKLDPKKAQELKKLTQKLEKYIKK